MKIDETTAHWFDEMATELRLREVRGDAIGDAIAEVETHCQEAAGRPHRPCRRPASPGGTGLGRDRGAAGDGGLRCRRRALDPCDPAAAAHRCAHVHGVITCAAMLSILLPQVALRGPLVVSAVLTVGLLAVSVVGMYRRSEEFADPLVDPRGGRSSVDRRPGITRAMLALLPWLLPIAAAVAALLEWATA